MIVKSSRSLEASQPAGGLAMTPKNRNELIDAARRLADAESAYRKVASAGDVLNRSPAWNQMRAAGDEVRAALAHDDTPFATLGKQAALEVAQKYGGIDGDHHKAWVIDQMVRALTGDGYDQFVADTCAGEEGPDTYFWGEGIAP